jgi:hypothetical protein
MEDGSEKPVAFASRTLAPAEKSYSQGLTVIFGIKGSTPTCTDISQSILTTNHYATCSVNQKVFQQWQRQGFNVGYSHRVHIFQCISPWERSAECRCFE